MAELCSGTGAVPEPLGAGNTAPKTSTQLQHIVIVNLTSRNLVLMWVFGLQLLLPTRKAILNASVDTRSLENQIL